MQNDFFDLGEVYVYGEFFLLDADQFHPVIVDRQQRLDAVRPDAAIVREDLGAAVQRELRHDSEVLPHRIHRRFALSVPLTENHKPKL